MNLKMTPKRKKIIALLKRCGCTLSAADIHQKLPEIDLVTIYRNLDLFVKEKIIKKVHLVSEETHYEFQKAPHHHAICTDCDKIIHFDASNEKIKKLLSLSNFTVDEIEVTVRGHCKKK